MMMIAEDQKCHDCLHLAAEHDTVMGCRHGFTEAGERYECVCHHYTT
jgi:hypothetical protein